MRYRKSFILNKILDKMNKLPEKTLAFESVKEFYLSEYLLEMIKILHNDVDNILAFLIHFQFYKLKNLQI